MALLTLQPKQVVVTASGLTTATTAYTAGDMLGSELTVAGVVPVAGGSCVLTSVMVESHTPSVPLGIDMRLFNAASTPAADNAANSWSDANERLQVAQLTVPPLVVSALNESITLGGLWIDILTAGSVNLFLNVITLSGHTFFGAATDLQYTLNFLQWV